MKNPAFRRAAAFLREAGAQYVPHLKGDLLSHLERVAQLLNEWGADDDIQLAGLCHATYGTDGFPTALMDRSERPRLARAIGDGAEAVVYRYCACDRTATYAALRARPLLLVDRFSRETVRLSEREAESFALLTIANELDVVRARVSDASTTGEIAAVFEALAPIAREAARRALDEIARDHA